MTSNEELNHFRAKMFKALADPLRLEILLFLRDGEKCVCEIIPHLRVAQPLVSRHLKMLKNRGLVRSRKEGNKRFYAVTTPEVCEVIESLSLGLRDSLSRRIVKEML